MPAKQPRLFYELLVAVEPHPLDLRLARRQADVPALVGLIAIEPTPGNPFSLLVEHAFLGDIDADQWRTRVRALERDRDARPANQKSSPPA